MNSDKEYIDALRKIKEIVVSHRHCTQVGCFAFEDILETIENLKLDTKCEGREN